MKDLNLKPCPFCAHKTPRIVGCGIYYRSYINCDACGSQGPYKDSIAKAITAWNKRKSEVLK